VFVKPYTGKKKKTILSYRMVQKISSKLLFISSPNRDGFYRVNIYFTSSVATQLRCYVYAYKSLYYKFSTEVPENRSIFGKDMDKSLWFTFLCHAVAWHVAKCLRCIIMIVIVRQKHADRQKTDGRAQSVIALY